VHDARFYTQGTEGEDEHLFAKLIPTSNQWRSQGGAGPPPMVGQKKN